MMLSFFFSKTPFHDQEEGMGWVKDINFFFQAEDGIRDIGVTGVQDVCSSDLISLSGMEVSTFIFIIYGSHH